MAVDSVELADVLGAFVARSGYTPGQLSRLSAIPKPTIVNWLEGRVKRPRARQDLLKLAMVLHLSREEVSRLLLSAGHPSVADLERTARQTADTATLGLLQPWQETAVSSPPPPSPPAPFQAMADIPTFVGREAELSLLREALSAATHPTLYVIQGMGGVGKTALAVRLTYRLRDTFPDGVLWARVDTSDSLSILGTFASAYGLDVSQYSDLTSRSRVVRELLAHKRVLMVLDGVDRSDQVTPLLPPTGTCAVLLTTRRHDLSVLRGAYRLVLTPFDPQKGESLALFARVLGNGRFQAEAPLLAELAELLGHLPLAVDIAAARLAYEPGWSTADFVARIRQAQRRLSELAFDEQNLRLSFEASYAALTPAEQRCFAALSVFPGEDFGVAAAAAVSGLPRDEAADALRRLFALSLVQAGRTLPGSTTPRYRLHRLLGDFARERLGEDTAVITRMVIYYTAFVAANSRHYALLELDARNIEAALEHATRFNMTAELIQGVNAFFHYLEAHGLYDVAAAQLAEAKAVLGPDDRANLLQSHHHQGRLAMHQGEYIEAEAQLEQALVLARELDDVIQLSHLLRTLGVLAARRGDYVLADAYYKEGLTLARELDPGDDVSNFLRGLGVQAFMRGDFARAEAFYEEGLDLMQRIETESSTQERSAAMLWGLGTLAEEQGDAGLAEEYYQQALVLARQFGHLERVIMLLRSLGVLLMEQARYAEATAVFAEALPLARDIGHRWHKARVLAEWGELQLQQGEVDTAVALFQELYTHARIMQSQELIATALYGLARLAVARKDILTARRYGQEALDTYVAIGHYKVQELQGWLQNLPD